MSETNTPFVNDDNELLENKVEKNSEVPADYLPIKLSSMGKLNMPKKIHVRNYSGQDALDLSISSNENLLDSLIKVLKRMIWEDVDPIYLHQKELEEIMLNIKINFWTSIINDYPYPYTTSELESLMEANPERYQRIKSGNEVPKVDLYPEHLKTTPLASKFNEPLKIKIGNKTVSFILPRISHILSARAYVEDKYFQEEQEYADVAAALEKNEEIKNSGTNAPLVPVDSKKRRDFEMYQESRTTDFFMAQQSQMIHTYDDKVLETLEEKMEVYPFVGLTFWKALNEIIEEQANFGLQENITVISPLTEKPETRRFRFRLLDFIPAVESEDVSGYTVEFG